MDMILYIRKYIIFQENERGQKIAFGGITVKSTLGKDRKAVV